MNVVLVVLGSTGQRVLGVLLAGPGTRREPTWGRVVLRRVLAKEESAAVACGALLLPAMTRSTLFVCVRGVVDPTGTEGDGTSAPPPFFLAPLATPSNHGGETRALRCRSRRGPPGEIKTRVMPRPATPQGRTPGHCGLAVPRSPARGLCSGDPLPFFQDRGPIVMGSGPPTVGRDPPLLWLKSLPHPLSVRSSWQAVVQVAALGNPGGNYHGRGCCCGQKISPASRGTKGG